MCKRSLEGLRSIWLFSQTDDDPFVSLPPGHTSLSPGTEPGHRGCQHHRPPAARPGLQPGPAEAVVLPALPGHAGAASLQRLLSGGDARMSGGGGRGAASLEELCRWTGEAGRGHEGRAGHGGGRSEAAFNDQTGSQARCECTHPSYCPGEFRTQTHLHN